jgi:hypothetical protein
VKPFLLQIVTRARGAPYSWFEMKRAIVSISVLTCLIAVTPALATIPTQPPPPQTVPPTDIATGAAEPSDTSARVLGYFNYGGSEPVGIAEHCWFEYGTTLAYGSRTDAICSGTTRATFAPLVPGTTYHYRAAASNSAGTSYGPGKTFTTLGSTPRDPTSPPPTDPPSATVKVLSGQSLASVVRRGLRLRVTLGGGCPCVVRVELLVSRLTARRLGLKRSRSIGSTRRQYAAAGTARLTLKLKPSAKRKLRRSRVLRATARLEVSSVSGEPTVSNRPLRLKRAG